MNRWAGRMAQFVKALAAKPDELSSVPRDGAREATPQSCPLVSTAHTRAHHSLPPHEGIHA